ncbi:MAG TPA: 23S rRNA (pseudouridine(1915)-N(3))-methyltransferase RlmH [Peptococcaceae bacterium]|nr:23S rRNA (pseudouridine(1915)-N(3))-methyltransferase RlmH [Peptococcaceae bacterium]
MKIILLAVGTLKEKYFREACAEYTKRLSPMIRLEIAEIKEETLETKGNPALIQRILAAEGSRILKRIPENARVIPLALEGKQLDSEAFAAFLDPAAHSSVTDIVFIIGGSHGLSKDILDLADWRLNFGPMTFPHQLVRVLLLEQIYRAQMILAGRTYHK